MILDKDAEKILKIFKKTLQDIPWWIDCGTLLCIYRDGTLQNTSDIDIGMFNKDRHLLQELQPILTRELGHFRYPETPRGTCPWIYEFPLGQVALHVDLGNYYTVSSIRIPFNIPKKFHETHVELFWRDVILPIPNFVEEYLAWYYGPAWRTPMTNFDYARYQQFARSHPHDAQVYPVNKPLKKILKWKAEYDQARTLPLTK